MTALERHNASRACTIGRCTNLRFLYIFLSNRVDNWEIFFPGWSNQRGGVGGGDINLPPGNKDVPICLDSKRQILILVWLNVEPPSATLAQHWPSIGSMYGNQWVISSCQHQGQHQHAGQDKVKDDRDQHQSQSTMFLQGNRNGRNSGSMPGWSPLSPISRKNMGLKK